MLTIVIYKTIKSYMYDNEINKTNVYNLFKLNLLLP